MKVMINFTEKNKSFSLLKQTKETEREQKIQELTVWQDNCFHLQIRPIDLDDLDILLKN